MMIEIAGLRFSYGSREVLKGVRLSVDGGRIVSILGPNGSGKTTLLRCVARVLRPKAETVFLEGKDIARLDTVELAKRVGYVPQIAEPCKLTVFDVLLLGRKPYIAWSPSEEDLRKVEEVLRLLGLEGLAGRFADEVSGGELQKVAIGRALVREPKVLLLDEPVNNLDPKARMDVLHLIREVTKLFRIATLMVMHDINLALRFSDSLLFLKNGRVYALETPQTLTPNTIKEVFGLDVEIINHKGVPIVVPSGKEVGPRRLLSGKGSTQTQ